MRTTWRCWAAACAAKMARRMRERMGLRLHLSRSRVPCHGSGAQVLIEEIEGSLPGQLGGSLVVPRRGVVVEAVVRAFVYVPGVVDLGSLESLFIGGPVPGDSRVERGILEQ